MNPVLNKVYDLSVHNGIVDWQQVKETGVEFVMLRAGYGKNNIDQRFYDNATACVKFDIPFGIYWFSYAYTVDMAEQEAEYALAAVEKYKMRCPISYDLEYDTVKYAATKNVTISKTLASDLARAFLRRIQAAGFEAWNYANKDYLQNMFDSSLLAEFPLWFARYNSESGREDMVMWQYSSKGRVSGIIGDVDCNIAYGHLESINRPSSNMSGSQGDPLSVKEGGGEYSYQLEGNQYLALGMIKTNFKVKEFQCKDRSDRILIDKSLLEILHKIRIYFNAAVSISSGYRTESYNQKVGGAKSSYHLSGKAADIRVAGITPAKVAAYAESIGVQGIGLYSTSGFTHVDTRTNRYFWLNESGNKVESFGTSNPYQKPPAGTVLKKGMVSAAVKWLQTELNRKHSADLKVDGAFGELTERAVISYQKRHGLAADGKAGDITIGCLTA